MGLIPVETRLVPIVLALRDGYPQLLMAPVDPTVVMNIHAHRGPNRRTAQGDPGAWIAQLVAPQLHGVALTSKFTSLLPRPIRDGQLAIPVWATARVDPNAAPDPNLPIRHSRHFREPMLVDARDGLERLGDELGDPDFGREVLAAVLGVDSGTAERLVQRRQLRAFESLEQVRAELPPDVVVAEDRVDVRSTHFVVHGRLRLDDRVLEEVAWLHRADGRVVVERRRRQPGLAEFP